MQSIQKQVTVIPAKKVSFDLKTPSFEMIKVAAYGRVSTDKEEQAESYAAQKRHYESEIKRNPQYDFVRFYGDEAKSGTSTKGRDEFRQMISDALNGKIDMIITKSISRFARNTLDTLTYVRKLKEKGVAVYFETQNINTLDSKGEVLLTILSALAQDEIRCLSENVAWGKRAKFKEGETHMATKRFLGYTKNADGDVIVDKKEAEVVRLIYKQFCEGKTTGSIVKYLEKHKIKAPAGGKRWHEGTVKSILTNERYIGDTLLQKSYVPDFLTKKCVKNDGVLPQYYIGNSHDAIISKELFELAQSEMNRRKGQCGSSRTVFGGKIICGECGGFYGRKVWNSNSKYRREIWRCNEKYKTKGKKQCNINHIDEKDIKQAFIQQFNALWDIKDEVISSLEIILKETLPEVDYTMEMSELERQIKELIDTNSRKALDQKEYNKQYEKLSKRYKELMKLSQEQEEHELDFKARKIKIAELIETLKQQPEAITEFDEGLWTVCVENAIVNPDGIVVNFKGVE